jgi:hypothetical protein
MRGSKKIPFEAYFVSALYAMGLPGDSVCYILKNRGLITTVSGYEWITNKRSIFTSAERLVPGKCAVLTLGHWNVVPTRLIREEEEEEKPLGLFDWTEVKRPYTPFIKFFVNTALRGGSWIRKEALGDPASDFYRELYDRWGAAPTDAPLFHSWTETQCIALPRDDRSDDKTLSNFINVPLTTYLTHYERLFKHVDLRSVGFLHLRAFLSNADITDVRCSSTVRRRRRRDSSNK